MQTSSPLVEGSAIVQRGDLGRNVILKGIFLEQADLIYELKEKTIRGIAQIGGNGILIGKELAEDLRLEPADTLNLLAPSGKSSNFIVNGIFDLKNKAINSSWIFLDLASTQILLGLDSAISSIEIQIEEVFQFEKIAQKLREEFPRYNIETWQNRNKQLLNTLHSQNLSSYMIQFFVLAAVTLGIASVLVVSVTQRIEEIGILKAIGTTNKGVSLIFFLLRVLFWVLFGSSVGAFLVGRSSVFFKKLPK